MMKHQHLHPLLLVLLQCCVQARDEFDSAYEENAHSQQEEAYYRALHGQARSYVPPSPLYIDSLLYPQLAVSYQSPVNYPFKSVWELTDFRKKYEHLKDQCVASTRKDSTSRRFSACSDSVWALEYAQRIGPVRQSVVLCAASSRGSLAILYLDARLEDGEAGCWIGIREKGRWHHFYTGLVQNHFLYIKPRSTLAFWADDSARISSLPTTRRCGQYRSTNPVTPKIIFLTPLFRINNLKHSYKITIGSDAGTDTY
jgi:hypothetical protein